MVGGIAVVVSQQSDYPEEEVEQVEGDYEQHGLLPQVYCLVSDVGLRHLSFVVEDHGEEGDGVEPSWREVPCVYHQWPHGQSSFSAMAAQASASASAL